MLRFNVGLALAFVVLALAIGGCSTMRGAPKPLVSRSQINGSDIVDAKSQVDILVAPSSREARNEALLQLMALADMRYVQYKIDLVNNRRGTRAGSGSLTLLSDIAATLTNSVGVKNNYIALSALIDGGEAVFDKEYLFDKTIDSLVARMDADRKAKQVDIYRKLEKELLGYSGQSALADALEYFHSGTLNSALVSVNKKAQAEADADRMESEALLVRLVSPTAAANADGNNRMDRFVESLNDINMEKLRNHLINKGYSVGQDSTEVGRRNKLRQGLVLFRTDFLDSGKTEADVVADLQRAGFAVPE